MNRKAVVPFLLVFLLAVSESQGRSITQAKVDQIKPYLTTEADLVHLFGKPITRQTDIYRMTSLTWFDTAGPNPAAYLPVIGPFLNAFETDVEELSVVLGPDGRVRSWTINGTKQSSRGRVRAG